MNFFSENLGRKGVNICLIVGMLFLCNPTSKAIDYHQHEPLSIRMNNVAMPQLFENLQQQTGLRFVYAHRDVEKYNVQIDVSGESLEHILDRVLAGKPLTYKITNDNVVISRSNNAAQQSNQQTVTISGNVTDQNGNKLTGATIRQKGSNKGVFTDADGSFRISITQRTNQPIIIVVSFLGYAQAEVECTPGKPVQVALNEAVRKLDDVNVISTGVFNKPKESFTGAITHVTQQELKDNMSRGVVQTLALIDPSFRLIANNEVGSNPNFIPKMELRGASTLEDLKSMRGRVDEDMQSLARSNVNAPLIIYDGFEISLERFVDLSEDEIESITMLKDAGATSLYGSRGANGVIVVTSVKPEAGAVTIRYSAKLKLEIPDLSSYNYMDAKQKLEAEALAGIYDGDPTKYEELYDKVYNQGVNHDWMREPVRTGIGQSHAVTLTGGDEILRFNARASYDQRKGTMKGSDRNVFSGSLGLVYTKGNINVTQTLNATITSSQNSPFGTFADNARMNPYWTPKNENGEWILTFPHPNSQSDLHNHVYNGNLSAFDKRYVTDYSSNTALIYTFLNDFRVEGRFSISRTTTTSDIFKPASHTHYLQTLDFKQKGNYTKIENENIRMSGALNLVYGKEIGAHSIYAAFNTEVRSTDEDSYRISATGFLHDEIRHISNAIQYAASGSPTGQMAMSREVQFMGTANYYYGGRYFADVMWRSDGASSFGRNSRWSPFYSAGVGWVVSGESFFNVSFIDLLRFKYSYGVSGSLNYATPHMAMFVLDYDITQLYAGGNGAYLNQYGNELLSWQRSYQHNVSMDLNLLGGWIDITGSYYTKLTKDAVEALDLTPSHGYDQFTGNIGDIRNTGWELGFAFYVVKNKDLKIRINPKFSANKNVIVKLSDQMKANLEANSWIGSGSSLQSTPDIIKEGQSLRAIFVANSPGVDPISGRRLYTDGNGVTGFGASTGVANRVFAGNGDPKVQSSWFLFVGYKGFSINAGISARWGGYAYNWTAHRLENVDWTNNLDRRVYTGRWRKVGDNTLLTDIANGESTYKNSQFVEKDNSLTLSTINLSYDFPRSWLKKTLNMQSMRVSVQLSDIWTTSTIWRERGTSYPYSVNPNFSFECSF